MTVFILKSLPHEILLRTRISIFTGEHYIIIQKFLVFKVNKQLFKNVIGSFSRMTPEYTHASLEIMQILKGTYVPGSFNPLSYGNFHWPYICKAPVLNAPVDFLSVNFTFVSKYLLFYRNINP